MASSSLTTLATDSFSQSWLSDFKPPSMNSEGLIMAKPFQSFNFDFSVTLSPQPGGFAHADELFSDGFIRPVYGDPLKMESCNTPDSTTTQTMPMSSSLFYSGIVSPRSLGTHHDHHDGFFTKWRKSSQKILRSSFGYFKQLYRRVGCSRKSTRVGDFEKAECEVKSWSISQQSSPISVKAYSMGDYSMFDYENSIHEAVLHCKRSIDEEKREQNREVNWLFQMCMEAAQASQLDLFVSSVFFLLGFYIYLSAETCFLRCSSGNHDPSFFPRSTPSFLSFLRSFTVLTASDDQINHHIDFVFLATSKGQSFNPFFSSLPTAFHVLFGSSTVDHIVFNDTQFVIRSDSYLEVGDALNSLEFHQKLDFFVSSENRDLVKTPKKVAFDKGPDSSKTISITASLDDELDDVLEGYPKRWSQTLH
ncbi:hypothetical protein K1719_017041 [Acacia pycnantha]|nr:hypothetical protein K1719_017041 [Acacia pycnantha]